MPLSLTEDLTYVTVRIEALMPSGTISTGTAFFFNFFEGESIHIPVIVTNKHVVAGSAVGRFNVTKMAPNGEPDIGSHMPLTLDNFENRWINHPDPSVDLCIMPIAPLLRSAQQQGVNFFYRYLASDLIPTYQEFCELTAMEDIAMIGYPNGIWDSVNNQPIIRRGITATHPKLNYEGRHEFVIDCACFPGSSGSPVMLLNLGSYQTRDGETMIGTRIKFLGVLYAGPQHTAEGEIRVVTVPTVQVPMAVSTIPNNLGFVIRSSQLVDFEPMLRSMLATQH